MEATLTEHAKSVQRAEAMIDKAIGDFERFERNTYGRRDAKLHLRQGIAALIDAKINAALAELLLDHRKEQP
jgi:hypothetical protein